MWERFRQIGNPLDRVGRKEQESIKKLCDLTPDELLGHFKYYNFRYRLWSAGIFIGLATFALGAAVAPSVLVDQGDPARTVSTVGGFAGILGGAILMATSIWKMTDQETRVHSIIKEANRRGFPITGLSFPTFQSFEIPANLT